MNINLKIGDRLKASAKQERKAFLDTRNTHPLLVEIFEAFEKFDFENYRTRLSAEIKENLRAHWSNVAKGIDPSEVLDAVLLEYGGTWWTNRFAYAYGIINWENYHLSDQEIDLDTPYDFAAGFEHVPGISVDYFNCFSVFDDDEKIESEYGIESSYDEPGFIALTDYVEAVGLFQVHNTFLDLCREGIFGVLNCRKNCPVLLADHDGGDIPVLVINETNT